jgi:hypothetical protein
MRERAELLPAFTVRDGKNIAGEKKLEVAEVQEKIGAEIAGMVFPIRIGWE